MADLAPGVSVASPPSCTFAEKGSKGSGAPQANKNALKHGAHIRRARPFPARSDPPLSVLGQHLYFGLWRFWAVRTDIRMSRIAAGRVSLPCTRRRIHSSSNSSCSFFSRTWTGVPIPEGGRPLFFGCKKFLVMILWCQKIGNLLPLMPGSLTTCLRSKLCLFT